jgi:hypothetical protein
MSRLSKEGLDELRKLNPPNDPRMFRRFLDTIDALTDELALNQAAIVRQVAAHQPMLAINDTTRKVWVYCSCGFNQNADSYEIDPRVWTKHILAIPTDQPDLDRHDAHIAAEAQNELIQAGWLAPEAVAERYITREEHNNIIRMNETAAAGAPEETNG